MQLLTQYSLFLGDNYYNVCGDDLGETWSQLNK